MGLRPGQEWGSAARLAPDGVVVGSDAEARCVLERARNAGTEPEPIGLIGGDLCRTLGGLGDIDRLFSDAAATVRVDVGRVELDGEPHWFVAHCVARHRCWLGHALVVMNAQWLGEWNLGPRAHPGDGLLDVTAGSLPWGDRREARRRARYGNHLPHPALSVKRTRSVSETFSRPVLVRLDGEVIGRAREVTVVVEPAALTVVV